MKYIASLFVICLLVVGSVGKSAHPDDQSYDFLVTGKVKFKKFSSSSGATVYVCGTRPINGRIPWAHANKDGTFAIQFRSVPDRYTVCAHAGETNGHWELVDPEKAKEAKQTKSTLSCSEQFTLDEQRREQAVEVE
jgi:hypothetical protein